MLAALSGRAGFPAPGIDILKTPCLWGTNGALCVNRVVIYMLLAAIVTVCLFVLAFRRPSLVPRGLQNVMEAIVEFVRNGIAIEVIGPEGLAFVPLLSAIFVFVLVGNLFEVIPGIQFPVNSRTAIPVILAVLVWFVFNIVGVKKQGGLGYIKSVLFPPGVPWPIYILVTPIEFVSTFVLRPFTLFVRLSANMIAGHLILTIFFVGTGYLLGRALTIPFAVPSFALAVGLTGFEILVSVLQAYIFTILTAVYIGGAIHVEH
ncbi:MAG: F0F1 ATP synthase subunit A [Actinobacteria bacterium]|nr:F0F1 ATP synthase subunit A [Actinomycetota bacterium]